MRILATSKALSKLTHQKGTEGNESLLNDEDVLTPWGRRKVAILSGNAIRNRMVRNPGAQHLVESLGIIGSLTRDILGLLYHGGLRREKSMLVSTAKIADMQRLFPLLDLLGCCLPEDIVAGKLKCMVGLLACYENADRINALTPEDWTFGNLPSASSFYGRYQYVRGKLTAGQLAAASDDGADNKMMPFSGTCVVPGAVFVHGFSAAGATQLHYGCLMNCLSQWDGTIGGNSSKGHGVLQTKVQNHPEWSASESIELYNDHISDNAAECRDWLEQCYVKPAKKASKKSKAKAKGKRKLIPDA